MPPARRVSPMEGPGCGSTAIDVIDVIYIIT